MGGQEDNNAFESRLSVILVTVLCVAFLWGEQVECGAKDRRVSEGG